MEEKRIFIEPNKRPFSGPEKNSSSNSNDLHVKKFTCSECNDDFATNGNLKRHFNKVHVGKTLQPLLKKDLQFKCPHCNYQFSKEYHLTYHKKKFHSDPIDDSKVTTCITCLMDVSKKDYLKHMEEEHGLHAEHETLMFKDMSEFETWKRDIEDKSVSKFNLQSTHNSHGSKYFYYVCHRTGDYKSTSSGERHAKKKGSYKTNKYCPAKINVIQTSNGCQVKYLKTHLGHQSDLGKISLSLTDKLSFAEKIAAKIPFDTILEDVRDSTPKSGLTRKHLLTKQDLFNIQRSFDLTSIAIRHKDDGTSVEAWIQAMKNTEPEEDSCILFYKPQGAVSNEHSFLAEKDFTLMIMNEAQAQMLKNFGSDCICIDGTHGLNPYDFELISIIVIDELRESFPVAFLITNRIDQNVLTLFFSYIKSKVGKIHPKVFMSDMAEAFYNSWLLEMEEPDHRLFCSWHVLKAWRSNLNKIEGQEKKEAVFKTVKCLLNELDPVAFEKMLPEALQEMHSDPVTEQYAHYFEKNYASNASTWAYCYRRHTGLNTNMHIESMHRTLKHVYFEGQRVKRLDKAIYAIMKFVRDKIIERFIVHHKGKLSSKIKELRRRHKLSSTLDLNIINNKDKSWSVSSSSGPGMYEVELLSPNCKCELKCSDCNVCIHAYLCSCMDSAIRYNMCKHIHFLHTYLLKEHRASNNLNMNEAGPSHLNSNDYLNLSETGSSLANAGPIAHNEAGSSHLNEAGSSLQICNNKVLDEDILIKELSKFNPNPSTEKNVEKSKEKIQLMFSKIMNSITTSEECEIVKKMVVSIKPTLAALNSQPLLKQQTIKNNKKYIVPQRRLFSVKRKRKASTKLRTNINSNENLKIAASLLINKAKKFKRNTEK